MRIELQDYNGHQSVIDSSDSEVIARWFTEQVPKLWTGTYNYQSRLSIYPGDQKEVELFKQSHMSVMMSSKEGMRLIAAIYDIFPNMKP
jgi:hypothetical protein